MKKYLVSITLALSLIGCGGGGGGGSVSQVVGNVIGDGKSTDYSHYAWSLNPDITSSFKTTYNIDNNAHISISPAWDKTKGEKTNGEKIKVAIIDFDFDPTHPDIKDKVIATYNVMDDSTNVSNQDSDGTSHGTAVAGIIASDSLGVAPDVELILINMELGGDNLTSFDIVEAFQKADELGAQVINCSWGGDGVYFDVMLEIMTLKAKNINIIFASGNDGLDLDNNLELEAELSSVIGVGATSVANDVTEYSNYGSNIDLLAPGGGNSQANPMLGIPTTDLQGSNGYNTTTDDTMGNNLLTDLDYTFITGTSFAAPTTSGVVALMLAVNPNLTANRVREILTTTTDKIGTSNGADYSTGSFDEKRAYGKINAAAAVQQAEDDL